MKPLFTFLSILTSIALCAQNASFLTTEKPSCAGGNNGSVTVQSDEFWVTYQLISPADTTIGLVEGDPFNLTNLFAGSYQLQIFGSDLLDSIGNTFAFHIVDPAAIQIQANIENACGNLPGSIELMVEGGLAPYSFQWEDGATTNTISQLSCGNYTVVVTDANDCLYGETFQVMDVLNLSSEQDTFVSFSEGQLAISSAEECIYSVVIYTMTGSKLFQQDQFNDCHFQQIDLSLFVDRSLIVQVNRSTFKITY